MPSSTVVVFSRGCLPAAGGCCGRAQRPVAELLPDRRRRSGRRPRWSGPTPGSSGSRPSFCRSTRLSRAAARFTARWSGRAISAAARAEVGAARVLEQPHAELQRQQPPRRARRSRPRPAARCAPPRARPRRTAGVVIMMSLPARTRHHRGVGVGGADLLLRDQPADVVPVGHDHALEAPLVLEHLGAAASGWRWRARRPSTGSRS